MQKNTKERSTLSRAGSPVSRSVRPGSVKARQMTVTSGRQCIASLEQLSPDGSFVRMFTALLIGMRGWYSTRCNLTWKLKVTKSQRMFCQLLVSTPRTKGIGSGSSGTAKNIPQQEVKRLLPTPTAFDGNSPSLAGKLRKREQPETASTLTAYVRHNWTKLVPTPTAMDATGCTAKMKSSQVKPGSMHSVTLSRWANMLPTPLASDCNAKRKTANWRGDDLSSKVQAIVGENGQLNPRFVAEMMGFPPNWTILPFQNGEQDQ